MRLERGDLIATDGELIALCAARGLVPAHFRSSRATPPNKLRA
jgi:hypothetical protein